jgi:hypothetical protein
MVATTSLLAGVALIAFGIPLSGYTENVALQLGSTVMLIAPLVLLERILADELLQRSLDEAEDRIATTLAAVGPASPPDSKTAAQAGDAYTRAVLAALGKCDSHIIESEDPGIDYMVGKKDDVGAVGIVIRHLLSPIPSGSIAELQLIAANLGTPLLLVTNSRLTNSASALLARSAEPGVGCVTWAPGAPEDMLCTALGRALATS